MRATMKYKVVYLCQKVCDNRATAVITLRLVESSVDWWSGSRESLCRVPTLW